MNKKKQFERVFVSFDCLALYTPTDDPGAVDVAHPPLQN